MLPARRERPEAEGRVLSCLFLRAQRRFESRLRARFSSSDFGRLASVREDSQYRRRQRTKGLRRKRAVVPPRPPRLSTQRNVVLVLQMPPPNTPRMLPAIHLVALGTLEVGLGAARRSSRVEGVIRREVERDAVLVSGSFVVVVCAERAVEVGRVGVGVLVLGSAGGGLLGPGGGRGWLERGGGGAGYVEVVIVEGCWSERAAGWGEMGGEGGGCDGEREGDRGGKNGQFRMVHRVRGVSFTRTVRRRRAKVVGEGVHDERVGLFGEGGVETGRIGRVGSGWQGKGEWLKLRWRVESGW